MAKISRRALLKAAAVLMGLPNGLVNSVEGKDAGGEQISGRWNPVAGSLESKFKAYDNRRSYFASRIPDNDYVAEIISARELGGAHMASVDEFLRHESGRYKIKPDIVLGGGNLDNARVNKNGRKEIAPDGFFMRGKEIMYGFRLNELYSGVLYVDQSGQLIILPLEQFRQNMGALNPVDGLQVELLKHGNSNLVSQNPTAKLEQPRHFMSHGNNLTYSVVMTWVDLTPKWIDWMANSFDADRVIALRGGHGAQSMDWLYEKSPQIAGNPTKRLLVNAIAIYSRSRLPK